MKFLKRFSGRLPAYAFAWLFFANASEQLQATSLDLNLLHLFKKQTESEKPKPIGKNCSSTLKKIKNIVGLNKNAIKRAAIWMIVFPSLIYTPTAYHNIEAKVQGKEHIGLGIYLDMDHIMSRLTPEERKIVENPDRSKEAQLRIVRIFAHKFYGDGAYESPFTRRRFFPAARDASTYMEYHAAHPGACAEKTVVLRSVLKKFGIKAEAKEVWFPSEHIGHMWVSLPELDSEVDLTAWSPEMLNADGTGPQDIVFSTKDYAHTVQTDPGEKSRIELGRPESLSFFWTKGLYR